MFTYQMVETDMQHLFEQLDAARRASFGVLQSASKCDDLLAASQMKDLNAMISKVNSELSDLNRKIERLKDGRVT